MTTSRPRPRRRDSPDQDEEEDEEEEGERTREPVLEVRLSTTTAQLPTEVIYDFRSGQYQQRAAGDYLIHLLTLPSRIIHREELELQTLQDTKQEEEDIEEQQRRKAAEEERQRQQYLKLQQEFRPKKEGEEPQELYDVAQDLEELYGNFMSPEQLAKLDSQPNPFNFSERVSQTLRIPRKDLAQQTDQPPSNTFGNTAGLSVLFDAYEKDYVLVLAREKQLQLEKEKEEEEKEKASGKKPEEKGTSSRPQTAGKTPTLKVQAPKGPPDPLVVVAPPPPQGESGLNLGMLLRSSRVVERTVHQNIYDEIIYDYKYWEDHSDDYRTLEGSLLPLWKLTAPRTRSLVVADVCWSPAHPDLLAAAYSPGGERATLDGGFLCIFTLKNPGVPERCLPTPCGLTSVEFHPSRESVVVAGRGDGAVMVYDARLHQQPPRVITSPITAGKHLLSVSQVTWIPSGPGQHLGFLSVAGDGRVTQWTVRPSFLEASDILSTKDTKEPPKGFPKTKKQNFKGTVTCLALKPDDTSVLLLGTEAGEVLEMTLTASTHDLLHYPAHTAPVRAVLWNGHHHLVFATCSLDWMLKIWLRHQTCPVVSLDLGAPVAGLSWCHYSSSLVVGVTEDGRVHIYDLFLRKCRPLCVQNLLQRRRSALACVAFSPFHPVLLVGGERGYLVTLKLSPNLRRPHKEAKGADEQKLLEIELAKLESIITTTEQVPK